jgi:hypothetical protein
MLHSERASPQRRFPAAKSRLERTRPVRREKMSVRRPERGWQAALAMR